MCQCMVVGDLDLEQKSGRSVADGVELLRPVVATIEVAR